MEAAEKIRQWLRENLKAQGISAAAWAAKAQLSPSTIQRAIKDDYQFVTSSRTLAKLANAIGIAPPQIEGFSDGNPTRAGIRHLPIRYEVGAGIWRSVHDASEAYGTGPVTESGAYAGFEQWLERVVTDSMNLEYPVGTLLHVVDAIAIGYAPRTGDHVIIERTQDGGMAERTCKEIAVAPDRVELWSRSTNPRWSEPVVFAKDGHDGPYTVQIVGLVLGSYRSRALTA